MLPKLKQASEKSTRNQRQDDGILEIPEDFEEASSSEQQPGQQRSSEGNVKGIV